MNGNNLAIDQVVIDIWCVPEPSSLGVLLPGIAGLWVHRRRR